MSRTTSQKNTQDCVVAIYDSFEEAKEGVHALDEAKYPREQVSFVTHQAASEIKQPEAVETGDKTEKDAVGGAATGGLLGLLIGAPLLLIPGLGPVLAAGPIATGLTGAIVGGFLGSMAGWGVHEDHIAKYQEQVKKGKVLVVASGDPQEVIHAKTILQDSSPAELHHHATSADSRETA